MVFSKSGKEIGKRLKLLRLDRGGEFISNEFNNFCIERGIKRQVLAPRTPKKKGQLKGGIDVSWIVQGL